MIVDHRGAGCSSDEWDRRAVTEDQAQRRRVQRFRDREGDLIGIPSYWHAATTRRGYACSCGVFTLQLRLHLLTQPSKAGNRRLLSAGASRRQGCPAAGKPAACPSCSRCAAFATALDGRFPRLEACRPCNAASRTTLAEPCWPPPSPHK